ncbi:acetamidase/formamidase family protein [Pseudonocardia sp.]|jgi:acetamidase/formamidase|uniref:acetamidase/formamidase family protein n=1 Tax=Pseudonocardia sp. TaxID=60912 RepID=UPI003D0F9920
MTAETVARTHRLEARPDTVFWGRLPCADDPPILTVAAGDRIVVDTVSHEGILEDQGRDPVRYFREFGVPPESVLTDAQAVAAEVPHTATDGPHVVVGPIGVAGAEIGDSLAIRIESLARRADYGIVSNRHRKGALPDVFPLHGAALTSVFVTVEEEHGVIPVRRETAAPRVRFPLAPFLGTIGVASAGRERLHSTPPGAHGGNLDISLLRPGCTLYLPVQVPGGNLYLGDPHYAQGNGEVALTAFEAPLQAEITVDVLPAEHVRLLLGDCSGPVVRTPDFLVTTGLDPDLDMAVRHSVQNAIHVLGASFGMAPDLAYAYLSAAVDFDISQVVDIVKGVHSRIRLADFADVPAPHGLRW